MADTDFFYTLASGAGQGAFRCDVLPQVEIVRLASEECLHNGGSLEDLAGIGWIDPDEDPDAEDWKPARAWLPGEELSTACGKLADDGRYFEAWPDTPEGRAGFLAAADERGAGADARRVISKGIIYDEYHLMAGYPLATEGDHQARRPPGPGV